jgi:ATP-binding cassette subfamily B protein
VDEADARLSDRIVEYVQGLPVLKAVGQAGAHSIRLAPVLEHQHRAQRETHRSAALPTLAAQLLVHLTLVVLVIVGAALALGAHLSPATLCALVVAAARLAEPLSMATVMTKLFEQAQAALRRVEDVLAVEPLPVAPGGRPPANFEVVFEDVTFAYDEHDRPALRAVSLTLPERSLTALVGPSGSGKTTISKLITRYADPHRGTVRLGGVDLRTLPPDEILRHVGVVFQDVYLFDDTIRANIALARPEAADAEVEQAARAANIHEFIAGLPAGYGTRVGEIGAALSGGERQRISIARAILKDAPVILLDEPTAALDAESEVAVQQAIARLVSGKTVLVIAHRLSTVVGADQILVLEDGAIVQRGTHAQLLADPGGRYAHMWAAQGAARDWHLAASRALGRWGTSPSRSSAAGLAES